MYLFIIYIFVTILLTPQHSTLICDVRKMARDFFSLPLLPKAKRSVGNKESGLDMLRPKIKLR